MSSHRLLRHAARHLIHLNSKPSLQPKPSSFFSTSSPLTIRSPATILSNVVLYGLGDLDTMEAALNATNIKPTPAVVTEVLTACAEEAVSRRLLRFTNWAIALPNCKDDPQLFNTALSVFIRKQDSKAMDMVLLAIKSNMLLLSMSSFAAAIDTLLKAEKISQAIGVFRRYNRARESPEVVSIFIVSLCNHGYPDVAEHILDPKMFNSYYEYSSAPPAKEIFYNHLVCGWSIKGPPRLAKKYLQTIKFTGQKPSLSAYNAYLDCLCKAANNPGAMFDTGFDIISEMNNVGVPLHISIFKTLITHLCNGGRPDLAMLVFDEMPKYKCHADYDVYVMLVKGLMMKKKWREDGDYLLETMFKARVEFDVEKSVGLVRQLIDVERYDAAIHMLNMIGNDEKKGLVYDAIIEGLATYGRFDQARYVWNEAQQNGVFLEVCSDILDPAKTEVRDREHPWFPCLTLVASKPRRIKVEFVKRSKLKRIRRKSKGGLIEKI